jgi:hypothetical protein
MKSAEAARIHLAEVDPAPFPLERKIEASHKAN